MSGNPCWVSRRTRACGGVLCGCGRSGDARPRPPPPPQVSVARFEKRVKDWDEFTGRFQAVETVEIRPRVSGYIDQVAFNEGEVVKAGDLLFVIDPRPYKADYDRAAADLKRYKTALDLARIESERVQRLRESGAVSQEELDERNSTVAQAEANVAGAQAALESAQLNMSFTRVTSPIDGRVSRAEVTRGNLVTGGNNGGTLLSSVVSLDPIYLYFDGDEQAYLRYTQMARAGRAPELARCAQSRASRTRQRGGLPARGHDGFRRQPAQSADRHDSRARGAREQGRRCSPPACSRACSCSGAANTQAILIDDRAVNTDQSQKYVFLLGADNKVEYRKVKLGRVIDGLRIVREGLKPGDVIVVNGAQRVHPGVDRDAAEVR